MNLCLDIGNSKIRGAVFRNGRPAADGVLYYGRDISEKKIRIFLGRFIGRHPVDRAGLISVSPSLAALVKKAFRGLPGIPLVAIVSRSFDSKNIRYRKPRKLGVDRLVNAYAAYHLYGGPALVVDIGTAVTWDAVDAKGRFLGGAIAPGPGTMAGALHQYTAALPLVRLRKRPRPAGRDTEECIRSGLYWGTAGMIRELIGRISRDMNGSPRVIFTGGLGPLFAREFKGCLLDELLTLKGIDLFLRGTKTKNIG